MLAAASRSDAAAVVPVRRQGYLAVGDGHRLYFEEVGSPTGLPVVFLHGGPGSGCQALHRRLFDPRRFRAILFDQRGCGRSRPLGRLAANTTAHLVADLEALRQALAIPAWIVFGGSWGSTLGLAYAQAHHGRVLGLVLRGLFLASREEVAAYVGGRHAAPAAWEALAAAVPAAARGDLLAAYRRLVLEGSAATARVAARAWLDYERALMGEAPLPDPPDRRQLAKVRIQMHYLGQDCFLAEGQLLAGIDGLRHLPAALIQGLADPVCPPAVAEGVHRRWPEAAWHPVAGGGHGGLAPDLAGACVAALDSLADRLTQG